MSSHFLGPAVEIAPPVANDADAALTRRLDFWNAHLLDLSKRNRLLYFNPAVGPRTRAPHGVRCIEPDCETLWNRLARRGKAQRFLDLESEFEQVMRETGEEPEADDAEGELFPAVRPLGADEVRTEPGAPRLGRLLTNLRSRARVSWEEAGVVTLFLAFGFVRWSEDEGEEAYAPLLLVPVELTRASPRDPYQLKRQDEEVLLNPALKYKLETAFKIVLPDAPSVEDKSLTPFFEAVQTALGAHPVAAQQSWSVLDWVYLGVFSFHKMAMFRDLRDHRAPLLRHPLVRALGGDRAAPLNPAITVPTGTELDALPFHEMELVLDADSSQHEAIIAARRGLSFVLQGPPGTGKSQTITNIIAECLEAGKTVLFVSEKIAALDVVHRRLKAVGLSDFCLEAHSHQANKRAIVSELDRTLRLHRLAVPPLGAQDEELERLRAGLNDYLAQLYHPNPSDHLWPRRVIAHLAELNHAPRLEFDFHAPAAQSLATHQDLEQWLQELDRLDAVWRGHATHPWRGVQLPDDSLKTRDQLKANLERAAAQLRWAATGWEALRGAWGLARVPSLHSLQRLLDLADIVARGEALCPDIVASWVEGEMPLEARRDLAHAGWSQWRALEAHRQDFAARWEASMFALDAAMLLQKVEAAAQWLGRVGGAETATEQRGALETHLAAAITHLDAVEWRGRALAATLGLEGPTTLAQVRSVQGVAQLVAKQVSPSPTWFAPGALAELETQLQGALARLRNRHALEAQLDERWQIEALLSLPLDELSGRFEAQHAGFFARWSAAFKADRARLQTALVAGQKFDAHRVSADLQTARELKTLREQAQNEYGQQADRFGAHWKGDSTNWNALQTALEAARELVTAWNGPLPASVAGLVCGPPDARESVGTQAQELEIVLRQLQGDLQNLFALFATRQLPFTTAPLPQAPLTQLRTWLATGREQLAAFFGALDAIDACALEGQPQPRTVAARFAALDEAGAIRRQNAEFAGGGAAWAAAFGALFEGESTRWDVILGALDWLETVRGWFGTRVPDSFVSVLGAKLRRQSALDASQLWRAGLIELEPHLVAIQSCFAMLTIGDETLEQAEFASLAGHFETLAARFDRLAEWLAYEQLQARAGELGLSARAPQRGFWEALHARQARGDAPVREVVAATFWRRFWTLWLEDVTRDLPLLRAFNGDSHDIGIARFARLDGESQGRARERLRATLSARKPVLDLQTPRDGQLGTLRHETVKKTRYLPIRALFEQTADVVQALKPCMLMSPLSVAQFLPPGKIHFDVVIFDEASQITPEDAIGAIVRGSQLIVVGDNQQMPPSQFFGAGHTDGDESEAEDTSDATARVESILDECLGAGLPPKKLLWHYRSRFEELIAFSNRHFYDGDLLTFPSPILNSAPGRRALTWERVEGFYTPGGSGAGEDAQTNRIEARRVAELAIEHARTAPEQSLGIITFNEPQRRAVEAEIYRLSAAEPALDAFFWAPREDGFFIKALENVQGDERDVIFFSVGFGPRRARDGTIAPMLMNFGPLGREGGERRLNVAITRARERVHVVTSFEPGEIDLGRAKSDGARLLRGFLEWARDSAYAAPVSRHIGAEVERADAIGAALASELQAAGWSLHQNVGIGEYRVDVGIEDPNQPGHLLLGVLCDGDSYQQGATARDRDRLRPQMLERLGWQLHRLWAPAWVQHPERELENVLEAVRRAHDTASRTRKNGARPATSLPVEPGQLASDFAVSPAVAWSSSNEVKTEEMAVVQTPVPGTVESEFVSQFQGEAPTDEGAVFVPVTLTRRGDAARFYASAETDMAPLLDALVQVVNGEGPVNELVAARRVVAAWDLTRAGSKVQDIVARVAAEGASRDLLQIRHERELGLNWYWATDMRRPTPRRAGLGSERRPDEIALEEIAEAALRVVERTYGVERDALIRLTARFLGWKQSGSRVQERIEAALTLLRNEARLGEKAGQYQVREQ